MKNLKPVAVNEYTDIKNNKHKVAHFLISDQASPNKEHIVSQLLHTLGKLGNKV